MKKLFIILSILTISAAPSFAEQDDFQNIVNMFNSYNRQLVEGVQSTPKVQYSDGLPKPSSSYQEPTTYHEDTSNSYQYQQPVQNTNQSYNYQPTYSNTNNSGNLLTTVNNGINTVSNLMTSVNNIRSMFGGF